ncbi:MAG: HU family DNA-binding protein [Deltaproteobacteria bacterium]|jgi:DNA-binding protein HU-beta|nr:HU family DNA-binding protein [Deltaproteobacteria bacterium]
MTKAELVAKIAEDADLTQSQATKALNSFLESVKEAIQTDGSVAIAGLGSFSIVERAARRGINPKTREPILIQATKSVKFRPAKALKDSVN